MSDGNGEQKTKLNYFLDIMYIAPQNAVDENGKPVLHYSRAIGLDKGTFDIVNDQLRNKLTEIFIPHKTKLVNGQTVNTYTYVNLNNMQIMKANTVCQEVWTEEAIKENRIKGIPVLYTADNQPIVKKNDNES